MNFVSFAQNFEDVVLWRVLNNVGQGRYLDIGAQDPIIDSISYGFYKAGWRGIHVEPIPFYAARLRECRPDELVLEAAVTDAPGPIIFHEIPETGLSTGKKDIAEGHIAAGYAQRELLVPCIRLDKLLQTIDGQLHWMKVDVEGMEADVLRSWGDCGVRPWVLVIESTYPNSQKPTQGQWLEAILKRGYREVFFDGLSRYFVHEAQAHREGLFLAPANIFDNFVVSRDHFTARLIRDEADEADRRAEDTQALACELRSRLDQLKTESVAAQSQISQLQQIVSETERMVACARSKEASAMLALARQEREHRTMLETARNDRFKAEAELRRVFLQKSASLRRDLRRWRAAESSARAHLNSVEVSFETLRQQVKEKERRWQARESEFQEEIRRLRQDLQLQLDAALQADRLIRQAVAEKSSRWRLVGQALGLSKQAGAWQELSTWSLPTHTERPSSKAQDSDERLMERIPGGSAAGEQANPYLRANSLTELLSWEDRNFVCCAFVTVLGRRPDLEGERYYLDRLRDGRSKLEILWQLRRSAEGQRHDPGIAGFDRALKRAAWSRKRLIGAPIRAVIGGEGDDRIERMRRALRNELSVIRDHLENRTAVGAEEGRAVDVTVSQVSLHEQANISPLALRALRIMTGAVPH